MKACLVIIVLAMASIVAAQTTVCPADWFPAVFTSTIDQVADKPVPFDDDPEFYFFKNVMKFRDEAIEHSTEDVIQFFNDSYGLDFSGSSPNAQNERFFQNARMNPFIINPDIHQIVTSSNWIRTGSICKREEERRNTYTQLKWSQGGVTVGALQLNGNL